MYILGINNSHDQSAALVNDGKVCVAIAEERLNRLKHSTGILHQTSQKIGPKVLPWRSITYCLQSAKLGLDDLDLVMVDHAFYPVDLFSIRHQFPIKDLDKIQSIPHPSHHLAHAYSAYFCSPFQESAVLVVDHIGSLVTLKEKESETFYYAEQNELSLIKQRFTHGRDLEDGSESPANLYRLITLLLGFTSQQVDFGQLGKWLAQYDDAGKTMGLAPYGVHRRDWEDWVKPGKDGLPTYINLIQWLRKNKFLNLSRSLSGDPQKDLLLLAPVVRQYDQAIHRVYKDLAFKAQEELEKCLLILTTHLFKKTRSENLCMAGGVALNSVANKKILDQGLFKSLFIQPAATDDGNAIGAAMYGYFKIFNGKNRFVLRNAFLGREYSQKEIENSLEKFFLFKARRYDDFQELIGFIATEISKGKVVGWFQGGSEFGQRALGNRSILADPRRRNMRDHLNFKVKGRESFRPFAPAVLFEYLSEYFVFEKESPFMLMVAPVKKGKISKIPAVTHIDGTARIQTVRREDNPKFYDLIKKFFEITGVPMLLNTSFNIKGYPMVETPSDAIWSFLNAPIDYLVMGNYLLNQELYSDLELMSYKPYKLVKIQEDYSSKPKSFVYDYDINRQEATILSDLEKEVLGYCEGKRTVQNLVDQHFVDRKQTLNMIRKFLRRQWIYLLLPN